MWEEGRGDAECLRLIDCPFTGFCTHAAVTHTAAHTHTYVRALPLIKTKNNLFTRVPRKWEGERECTAGSFSALGDKREGGSLQAVRPSKSLRVWYCNRHASAKTKSWQEGPASTVDCDGHGIGFREMRYREDPIIVIITMRVLRYIPYSRCLVLPRFALFSFRVVV